jgi:hypothetical protein
MRRTYQPRPDADVANAADLDSADRALAPPPVDRVAALRHHRAMRGAIAMVLAAGCWGPAQVPAAPPPVAPVDPDPPPAIRFVVLDSAAHHLRVLAVVPGKPALAIEREVEVADSAHDVVWAGPSAIAVERWDEGMGVIEIVDAHGLAALPAITWPDVAQPKDTIAGNESRVFTADKQQQLVLASCAWRDPDGFEWHGQCSIWQYARIWPLPVAVLDDAPVEDPARFPLPKVAPGKVAAAVDKDDRMVTCTDAHGRAHDLEPPESGALEVSWLVADPPIFRFDTTSGSGFGPGYTTHRIYEGCTRSRRYANAFAGPRGELVLVGHEIAVYWHGKLVARGPGQARDDAEEEKDGNDSPIVVAFAPIR